MDPYAHHQLWIIAEMTQRYYKKLKAADFHIRSPHLCIDPLTMFAAHNHISQDFSSLFTIDYQCDPQHLYSIDSPNLHSIILMDFSAHPQVYDRVCEICRRLPTTRIATNHGSYTYICAMCFATYKQIQFSTLKNQPIIRTNDFTVVSIRTNHAIIQSHPTFPYTIYTCQDYGAPVKKLEYIHDHIGRAIPANLIEENYQISAKNVNKYICHFSNIRKFDNYNPQSAPYYCQYCIHDINRAKSFAIEFIWCINQLTDIADLARVIFQIIRKLKMAD